MSRHPAEVPGRSPAPSSHTKDAQDTQDTKETTP
jgi:hypothetical protein